MAITTHAPYGWAHAASHTTPPTARSAPAKTMTWLLTVNPCDTAAGCTPLVPFWVFAILFPIALVIAFIQWHNDD
jgi:hypothetical protein